jgi:hypothetical protein
MLDDSNWRTCWRRQYHFNEQNSKRWNCLQTTRSTKTTKHDLSTAAAEKKQEIIHSVDWNAIVRSQIFFLLLPTIYFRIQFIPLKHPHEIQSTSKLQLKNMKQKFYWTLSCELITDDGNSTQSNLTHRQKAGIGRWNGCRIGTLSTHSHIPQQVSLSVTHSTEPTISPFMSGSKLKLIFMVG